MVEAAEPDDAEAEAEDAVDAVLAEAELAAIPNFGKKSIEEVKETLAQHGLGLRGSSGLEA